MEQSDLHNFFSRAKSVSLNPGVKATLRRRLEERMGVRYPTPTLAPHSFSGLRFAWAPAMAFSLIVLLTGGAAWTAEAALPGDPLYALKRHFNEPLRSWLSVTDDRKAAWSVELSVRRLGEAETLAAADRLDRETQTLLETALNEHVNAAREFGVAEHEIETEIEERLTHEGRIRVRIKDGRIRIDVRSDHDDDERGNDNEQHEREEDDSDGRRSESEERLEGNASSEAEGVNVRERERTTDEDGKKSEKGIGERKSIAPATSSKRSSPGSSSTSERSAVTGGSEKSSDDEKDNKEDEEGEEEESYSSTISESEARSRALAAVPGDVKDSEKKTQGGSVFWEVEIERASDGEEVKVKIDGSSGAVVGIDD
jgi:uncharacterized membrane protein YkoI